MRSRDRSRIAAQILVSAVLAQYGVTRLDFFIASHYDADHIGGTITGRANVHGTSFILGPNGEPGAVVDDDGDGHDGWLDTQQTEPDADELGTDDDIAIAHFVDRGDTPQPSSVTYDKYAAMANASRSPVARRWKPATSVWAGPPPCGQSQRTGSCAIGRRVSHS